ncbi:MAG: hypothetical protein AAB538_04465 [Patescibacteria group bacterium]
MREQLTRDGFTLVPRDNRLFDVFPHLVRHRGFELWEKWDAKEVSLVQIKYQMPKTKPIYLTFRRREVEKALLAGQIITS